MLKKAKEWIKTHQDEAVFGAVVAVYVGVVGGILYALKKDWKKMELEYEQKQTELKEAVARGATVLPGPDGEYWIIEKDTSNG